MSHIPAPHELPATLSRRVGLGDAGSYARREPDLPALPFNGDAMEASRRFCEGQVDQVAIFGPSGWGKTQILESAAETMGHGGNAQRVRLSSALAFTQSKDQPESMPILILDDLQDVKRKPRARHDLRHRLERRLRAHRPTLVSATVGSAREALGMLPVGHAWSLASVRVPTVPERATIVQQIAQQVGVDLHPAIPRLMAMHLHGNGNSIRGALQRLRLVMPVWQTERDVCQACGVLMPYLIGRNGWDPRDEVHDAVNRVVKGWRTEAPGSWTGEISAYCMATLVGLSEYDIADFHHIAPSTAYRRTITVRKRRLDPDFSLLVTSCERAVVRTFTNA